ncbi:TPA: hypothetical protein N0F65_002755 [Lagenidium giganteum]|uniref:Trafficking protein particle complex subunit 8 n=1 Tax=Lagenidium giganteum TaxID=4803 RepID=A0AAV2YM75_9STRA|nr:TPA: hypothetical protein N0F65_002755 [Lagenidium giganteum]
MDDLEKWVQETFVPVVLTCTTAEVERIAQKNNLAFADLLNGFAQIGQADTPIRSVNHQVTLPDFNFRFIDSSQFGPLPLQEATRMLTDAVARRPPATAGVIDLDIPRVLSVEDVPTYLRVIGASDNPEPLPWYREFKHTLLDTFRCEEYSMMCQPAAMLLVVSSTEGNPRHCFEQLGHNRNLPPVFHQGLYDANIPKYYLVLHDSCETEGTSIDPDAIFRNLNISSSYGAVLRINSRPTDTPTETNAGIWNTHPYVRPPLFPSNLEIYPVVSEAHGCILSDEDLARVHSFVHDFGLRFVLPSLESRIFQLNEVVSAMKKGVKNVFKSWLRKPKDLSTRSSSNSTVLYKYDSIEAQTRLLADTAFMVRDYELALQMYRLARDDFKSDKSMFHCANANEMISLCLLLTKGSPVQMTNALDAASATYVKINNLATCRLAVRTAVIAGEIFTALSRSGLFTDYMDNASTALIRGSTMEQGICSAVLVERAAFCDIQCRLPKFRKYGFRLVMAGHMYSTLGLGPHSARCYALARAIYDCSGWYQVEDHINFTLAQQAYRLSDPMASINLFLKLIGTGRNSASQQEALLEEFRLIVKEFLQSGNPASSVKRSGPIAIQVNESNTKSLLVKDLCMPELDDSTTVVFAPVNATGVDRDVDGNEADADAWKELDQLATKELLIHDNMMSDKPGSWLRPNRSLTMPVRTKKGALPKPDRYAVNESIYVEFEMKNALSCAVDVENIHVYGKFEVKSGEMAGLYDIPDDSATQGLLDGSFVNLQLLPCSEERVRLSVTPKVPGTLTIIGVRWSICGGDVRGEHAFNIPGPLLQDTRAHREARARAPNMTLIADVVGPMPWLGVQVERDTETAFVGEVMVARMSLFNAGTADLNGLHLCCSDAQLCVSDDTGKQPSGLAPYIGASGQVVDLRDLSLSPGESKQLTVWFRCMKPGKQAVRLLFKYHREDTTQAKPVPRTVKLNLDVNCLPSIDVAYTVDPSFGSSGEYVLAITATNLRRDGGNEDDAKVQLDSVVCHSPSWSIVKFTESEDFVSSQSRARSALTLGFQEASTTYFRIIPNTSEQAKTVLPLQSPDAAVPVHDHASLDQFLCLEHALKLMSASAGSGEATKPGGFRTIQSVRRDNRAMQTATPEVEQNGLTPQREPQPTTRDALEYPADVDGHLTLLWSVAQSDVVNGQQQARTCLGQTNITSLRVRSVPNMNACPLTITMQYPSTTQLQPVPSNPATLLSFAEVDVALTIRNDSTLQAPAIDFTVEMLHPEDHKLRMDKHLRDAAPPFYWSGLTKKRFAQFPPGAQETIPLKACFTAPGIYDLNRLRFVVFPMDTAQGAPQPQPSVFVFPVEYLIHAQPAGRGDPANTNGGDRRAAVQTGETVETVA